MEKYNLLTKIDRKRREDIVCKFLSLYLLIQAISKKLGLRFGSWSKASETSLLIWGKCSSNEDFFKKRILHCCSDTLILRVLPEDASPRNTLSRPGRRIPTGRWRSGPAGPGVGPIPHTRPASSNGPLPTPHTSPAASAPTGWLGGTKAGLRRTGCCTGGGAEWTSGWCQLAAGSVGR